MYAWRTGILTFSFPGAAPDPLFRFGCWRMGPCTCCTQEARLLVLLGRVAGAAQDPASIKHAPSEGNYACLSVTLTVYSEWLWVQVTLSLSFGHTGAQYFIDFIPTLAG